ncbi:dockerin type I domain-containing protein [Aureliella helgolandensis]|uniref:Dockerin type I repeat protein n=1 Tax=Aureliella helgolandensis TaxID=2527968 RepID=A0A518G326_9BACT|nr:dockerin type I domain-containing protein [Aureliella helgolandensis]QDV23007.1 Dockerin type I repeat protein [Aureliella helgolandensis]
MHRLSLPKSRKLRVEQLEQRRLLATFTVLNSSDSGDGSLRQAIEQSNANPDSDDIVFNIQSPSLTIQLASPLPTLTSPVSIDGTTQPGFAGEPILVLSGIALEGKTSGITIAGGDSVLKGMVIQGFGGAGVRIDGLGNNTISNTYIGTDATGETEVPNDFAGIYIVDSSNNVIGGRYGLDGNLISGNRAEGIRIEGSSSTGNRIQGNRIGTDQQGIEAVPNGTAGVLLEGAASLNVIGTNGDGIEDANERNLISGNVGVGVRVYGAQANQISGNWIGLTASGRHALANGKQGILVDLQSTGNMIGSNADGLSDSLERNVVSGNGDSGIEFANAMTSANVVSGNYIGTDSSGEFPVSNVASGVELVDNSSGNVIGTRNGEYLGNLISGNGFSGIFITNSNDNRVGGNWVGVNAQGSGPLKNSGRGVVIGGTASRNLIGTDDNAVMDEGERNVLSGNLDQGVAIFDSNAQFNVIAGNFIGTDALGTTAIPNTSTGILLGAGTRQNVVGTTDQSRADSAAGNLISGNQIFGLRFRLGATQNRVGGNWVGLDATGERALPNGFSGIGSFEGATDNLIGGQTVQERNVISGNNEWGIRIQEDSGGNAIDGNWIGLSATGAELGNLLGGILLEDAADNSIGDLSANIIAFNGATGVAIEGDKSVRNWITKNAIFGHTGLGIDLSFDGADTNDLLDADSGPNDLQNYPVIEYVQRAESTNVSGVLNSLPNTTFLIELYVAENAESRQGQEFLNSVEVTTDGNGLGLWSASLRPLSDGQAIIATTRNLAAGHSEFSIPVVSLPPLEFRTPQQAWDEASGSFTASVHRNSLSSSQALTIEFGDFPSEQIQLPSSVTIPAGQESTDFVVGIVDDSIMENEVWVEIIGTAPGVAIGKLQIIITDNDVPKWHNAFQPLDVSGDRFVSPLDALLVINFLNSNLDQDLADREPLTPSVFMDVNEDGFITPFDALLVINFLNNNTGEGEASAPISRQSAIDQVFSAPWDGLESSYSRLSDGEVEEIFGYRRRR